jgi:hypothetical protein
MEKIKEFPLYVGFGRLNVETVSENSEIISAEYFFNNRPVHKISYNRIYKTWIIEDIFNNTGGITSSSDLKNAVMRHFNNLDCETNGIFHYFRDIICSRGNIYFQNLASMKDKDGVVSYFPAGRLIILRIPIFFDNAGRSKVDLLINNIPYLESENRPLLKLLEAYNTSILLTEANNKISVIPVLMVEYIITLASALDVVDWMCNNKLLGDEKIFRMIIQDAKLKNQHYFETFEVHDKDAKIYSILFKGMDDSKIKFGDLEKKVIESFANN